jgi:hypothetical protein
MDVRALPSCSSPLTVFTTSSVHCFISPIPPNPHPWTWKDGLNQVRDYSTLTTWANHFSWRMRNNHLLLRSNHFLRSALPGHCESVHFYQPKEEGSECFSSSKQYCKRPVYCCCCCCWAGSKGPQVCVYDTTAAHESISRSNMIVTCIYNG